MRKSLILFAFLLGCIGLQAQNYHITLHRSGSVIHNNDVNVITEIVFQGHDPASMVINTESGTYTFPITRFDSITFHTEEIDIPHGDDFMTICDNELPYTWQGVTFHEGGIQNVTLQTPQGNDSIVSLHLTVYPTQTSDDYLTVCPSALPYDWQGVTFYEAGTKMVTYQTIHGCDSIVTLHLSVSESLTGDDYMTICSSVLPYSWQGVTFNQAGTQTITLQSSQGCDSIVTLHLSVSETLTGDEYLTICDNELPYTWHGLTFTASGTQSLMLQSSLGCDSIVTLHLTAYPTQYGDDYLTIYDNQLPYTWQGVTFTGEGTQTITLHTEHGCDSIVTLHLTVAAAPVGDTVYITYNGGSVSVINPFASTGVTVTNTGAEVVVNSTRANVPYVVSGSSSDGSLIMYSTNNFFMALSSLSLSNTSTAAINIASEVNVTLQLRGSSTLADGTGHLINGALNSAGDLSISGGSLNITGNDKHAINTEGTLTINSGSITVVNAATDGLHANAFVQNGGSVIVNNCGSDGIETATNCTINSGNVDITSSAFDSKGISVNGSFVMSNGNVNITTSGTTSKGIKADNQLVISGGTVTVHVSGDSSNAISCDTDIMVIGGEINIEMTAIDCKGFKSNGTLDVTNGNITITSSQNESNGMKADGELSISGGTIDITVSGINSNAISTETVLSVSGGNFTLDLNAADCKGLNSNGTITVSGGIIGITSTGASNKGVKADDSITFSAGTLTLNISGNDANGISSDVSVTISNTADITITTSALDGKGIKSDGTIDITDGSVNITHSGNTSKGISADGNINISNGTIVINANGSTVVTNNEPSYCTAIKGDADINISGGDITITLPTSNQGGKGIKCAGNMTISGDNTINIETHGNGATYTASSGTDVYSSSCLRSEGNMQILSGNITLTSSGNGGKGIKVGTKTASGSSWGGGTTYTYTGTYTQGNPDGTGPTLTVSTTGSEVGSSGGGWGPGGGSSSSAHASAKAIKVGGVATIYGGTTTITTTKNKAEGFESKTQINVEGGQHYLHCYDDCMNSAGPIIFNGGVTVCYGYGNDAIDSNAGTAGAITIGNGVAFAYTTKGDPEEGFDCDNNSYIRITGTGIGISAGGSQGGGGGWGPGGGSGTTISGAVQGYYFYTSSYSFQAGRYYTLSNTSGSGGSNLVTFSFEGNCTSKLALITATGMQHGSTYYVKYGNQAPTNPTTSFHGLYLGGTSSASTQAFSFTAQ